MTKSHPLSIFKETLSLSKKYQRSPISLSPPNLSISFSHITPISLSKTVLLLSHEISLPITTLF
ncbi:hypothetical protein AMTRI_Chr02g220490 [Amborella trichopoda]